MKNSILRISIWAFLVLISSELSAGEYKLPNFDANVYQIAFPSPLVMIIGGDYGKIWKAVNGVENAQEKISNLPSNVNVFCIKFLNATTGIATSFGALVKTTNAGDTWTVMPSFTTGRIFDIYFFSETEILAVTSDPGIWKTTNGGLNWTNRIQSTQLRLTSLSFIGDIGVASEYYWGTMPRSTDRGNTWQIPSSGTNWSAYHSTQVNGKIYLAGSFQNITPQRAMILTSTNLGVNWQETQFPLDVTRFSSIAFLNSQGFAVGYKNDGDIDSARAYKTSDGVNWQRYQIAPFRNKLHTVVCNNNSVYIGADHGWIYWEQIVGINPISTEIPTGFELQQNYPNPFNPTTKINFSLPKSGYVSLVVYDINGKEVETLVHEFVLAGEYSVNFDASQIPSGMYFYSLVSEQNSATKKMILVK